MWSIVPFKVQTRGKRRLAGMLSRRERTGLSRAMIEDLLNTLRQVQLLDGNVIVSDDAVATALAEKYTMTAIREDETRGKGLNNAISWAITRLNTASVNDVMIIHGDLPMVSPADLTGLISQHLQLERPAFTLVPDRWRRGTNCLLSTSVPAIPLCFGEGSLVRHQRAAEQQGVPLQTVEIPSIMFDIDTPADLLELKQRLQSMDNGIAPHTRRFLETLDLAQTPILCTVQDEEYDTAEGYRVT